MCIIPFCGTVVKLRGFIFYYGINGFSDSEYVFGVMRIIRECDAACNFKHLFSAREFFKKPQSSHILQRLAENFETQRTYRFAVFTRINDKQITRREMTAGIGHFIWINLIKGILSVIEVKTPLKETVQVIFPEEEAENTVSLRRHSYKPVRHIAGALTAAVIGPQRAYPAVKIFNAVFGGHRNINGSP